MALSLSLPLSTPFPKLPSRLPKFTFRASAAAASSGGRKNPAAVDAAVLEAVAQSEGRILPCVRSYENDLARLTLVGAADFEQALTAAAADGGNAADEHIAAGVSAMVVETVFPGPSDEHSTVSTRLFLPARRVKEKARKLRSTLTEDLLSSTTSRNILAMTFRQVVLQQLWNFELVVFLPGAERDMDDLESPRQVTPSFTLSSSSSDQEILSSLAEALCILSLETTKGQFSSGKASNGFFNWSSKTKSYTSNDSTVTINVFEDELLQNARLLLEKFNTVRRKYDMKKGKPRNRWWASVVQSKLDRVGGSEFSDWASEYVGAYGLQVDTRLTDIKFEAGKRTENRWEVLLTHSQTVGLASILDMYFEDEYSLPDKHLLCGVIENPKKLSERRHSMLGTVTSKLAAAAFLVSIGVLGQIYFPNFGNLRRYLGNYDHSLQSTETSNIEPVSLESSKLEAFCTDIVRQIKDFYDWKGDIESQPRIGAWIGERPIYLRKNIDKNYTDLETSSSFTIVAETDEKLTLSAQNIASYKVVLSTDGKIIGLEPMNLVAVDHLATNPLANKLSSGRELTKPAIVLELLMSVNPDDDNYFAFTRPLR